MYQPYTLPASTAACSTGDGSFNQMMDPSMLGEQFFYIPSLGGFASNLYHHHQALAFRIVVFDRSSLALSAPQICEHELLAVKFTSVLPRHQHIKFAFSHSRPEHRQRTVLRFDVQLPDLRLLVPVDTTGSRLCAHRRRSMFDQHVHLELERIRAVDERNTE
ncbi:hypothetical protein ANCDUO_01294 [Ancylostoma duodenale]|uniref:Uncharacterized protein n=1 Tax=Ancylostoma duodenale TaxID=51022 RepID=A0A0C2H3I2_9BILA|nr:hypothetical protein ANCDUO_01294 [Ancylostoma duodenale]